MLLLTYTIMNETFKIYFLCSILKLQDERT